MVDSLSSSVTSLRTSLQLLESSIDILDTGVNDFPRLSKVLQTTRHFELLPEPTLQEAQQSLLDEITPSIAHLLSITTNHVERLARREDSLRAKCQLQEGRLSDERRDPNSTTKTAVASRAGERSDAGAKAAQLRRLVQKKERLKYAVDRLELQSRQKERELRKSMAAQ
ncbi:mitotic spindle biogenesis protein Spc19, putative [Talaromyces stipitatus ATCC 10500]|uniref:DASH complex subunit SPC19 n=1 Tax=Talaromyces stipitatus (strain ATCC 10500 / CBS 375.48 / QM 6759 / NRRL 1006) TaxID=441959 RepID=B8M6Y3_TALSN|nr:mitotic spindle biogenesis protein Spc19, putative [Talaromyces stipitatus ATCC 10500]EED20203.1 mitotic spindle biogenesis protein Spc19, putative [Talaromyces stipitatus ATCC 10500]